MTIHFFHQVTPAFIVESLASGGHFLQAGEQESG
jgi:hypothetical protein